MGCEQTDQRSLLTPKVGVDVQLCLTQLRFLPPAALAAAAGAAGEICARLLAAATAAASKAYFFALEIQPPIVRSCHLPNFSL